MDASPTSTSLPTSSFYTEDKTVILVHVPCLQVIPDVSELGQQYLASERKNTLGKVNLPVIQNVFLLIERLHSTRLHTTRKQQM